MFPRMLLRVVVLLPLALLIAACGGQDAQEAFAVGAAAPDFSLPSYDGGEVALGDYVGQQPVLLYFHMALG